MTVAPDAPTLTIGGSLEARDALAAGRRTHRLTIDADAQPRIEHAAARIQRAVDAGEWVYGVTTGFGSNSDIQIDEADAAALQRNLLVSHALGEGDPLPAEVVRLALLLRIHALAQGHSGIRPTTLAALIALYENDILAVVPERGSVGASGDLAPLSCLALPLIGEGRVLSVAGSVPAAEALQAAGLSPITLSYKEGLALVNGMQVSLAIALFAAYEAETALLAADLCAALSTEALAGRSEASDARMHAVRRHPGQSASARRIRSMLGGSELVDVEHGRIEGKRRAPQDSYGIRCAAQVHGATEDGMRYAQQVFAREIMAVTDNPLVFDEDILSGGNFHGEPVALAADHLRLCTHELGSISERRTATLVDPNLNEGLPPYLAPERGLHSGFMIPQYVAAALVSETKGLCFPASADSIPTGAGIEDHVSMAPIAARRAREVSRRVHAILAIEALCAAQAIELRALPAGPLARQVVERIREAIPFRDVDAPWDDTLERATGLIASRALIAGTPCDEAPLFGHAG